MCGRFSLAIPATTINEYFNLAMPVEFEPRYNIAPSQSILGIYQNPEGVFEAVWLRWGFIASWQKAVENKIPAGIINARMETVAEKPMFKKSFQQRRCIIIASSFFEWKKTAKGKQPYLIKSISDKPLAFAGIYSHWNLDAATSITSCAILTTQANQKISALHQRMPVMLAENTWQQWLQKPSLEPELLADNELTFYSVSEKVNNARNDSVEILQAS